jgi:hypothetical protein
MAPSFDSILIIPNHPMQVTPILETEWPWKCNDQDGSKGDPDKVRIARRLRGETTMTLAWFANRLVSTDLLGVLL